MSCNGATKDRGGWIYKLFAYKNECKNCKLTHRNETKILFLFHLSKV